MGAVTVSKKGWVVIPKEIRERHDIRPGDKIHILDVGGSIAIVKASKDPIREARGMFKDGPSLTKELLKDRKREREHEEREIEWWIGRGKRRSKKE